MDCRKCLEEAGILWTSSAESDLQEGICPKHHEDERYECEVDGKRIIPLGVVKLI